MEIGFHYLIITGLLTVACVFLERWQPPLKKQYVAVLLFTLGAFLSFKLIDNLYYGILIAGLVYYKQELVQELVKIKKSFTDIKKEIDN